MKTCSNISVLLQNSLSSYDSYNKQTSTRIIPNAHDDLKTTLSKIDSTSTSMPNTPAKYNMGPRWDQNNRLGSKLDLKYVQHPSDQNLNMEGSSRNSGELEKDLNPLEAVSPRGSVERDMYRSVIIINFLINNQNVYENSRYARSPSKQNMPAKQHMETKTDYGKYR